MARFSESDVLQAIALQKARARCENDPEGFEKWLAAHTGKNAISPRAFELEQTLDPVAELVFALYFDLFDREIGGDIRTVWHGAPTPDGDFLLVPEDTGFSELSEELPSRIELNISLIVTMAWARLDTFNQTDRDGAATPARS